MKNQATVLAWRDWTLFGLKWLLLAVFSLAVYLWRSQAGATSPTDGLALPVLVGLIANLALIGAILVHVPLAVPVVAVIGDIAVAAAFMHLVSGQPLLVVGIAGAILASGLVRLGPIASAIQALGVIASVFVMHSTALNVTGQALPTGPDFTLTLVLLVGIALLVVAGSFALDRQVGAQARLIEQLRQGETAELNHMRERSRAIYELATTISSTLQYDRIMNAALDAGQLGVRDGAGQTLTSAVLLYQADDRGLYVAASRRFTRNDEAVVIPGVKGLVAQTLHESIPMFASSAKDDPELQYFSAFQFARSILCVPLRASYNNYGVLLYGSETDNAFDKDQSELLSAIGSQATIAMQNAVLYQSLADEKEKIVSVEEDARKKLARDLHDGPTQTVSAIAMRVNYITRLFEKNPAEVPQELKKVEELARNTAKEIRHMLFTLRPLVLESQGLGPALKQLGEKMQETHGQAVVVRLGRDVDNLLSTHQQGVLFYTIEEAVNNARKHAKASVINVTLGRKDQTIICQIADNGVGFDTSILNNYEKRGSLGMVNMKERVELMEGSFRIDSAPGKGTSITIYIPIKNRAAQDNGDSAAEKPASRNGKSSRPATKLAMAAVERYDKGGR
jgi:signal transduction histidine kinase